MSVDYRLFPGIIDNTELIVSESKKFLGVTHIIGRGAEVSGLKRMIVFLLRSKYMWKLEDYGAVVNVDHSMVLYYERKYSELYNGGSLFYTFAFLTLQAKINNQPNFSMKDVFLDAIEKMPATENEKIAGLKMLDKNYRNQKTRNVIFRAFVLWFIKHGVSATEINEIIGVNTSTSLSRIFVLDKHLYLSVIDAVVIEKINILKQQQNEKWKIDNKKENDI